MITSGGPFCPVAWFAIEPQHPAFAGHFPDQPIVPGVVLLDHAQQLLHEALDARAVIAGIPVAKFLRPVLPGEVLLVGLESISPEQLRFVCCADGQIAAQGTFRLATGK